MIGKHNRHFTVAPGTTCTALHRAGLPSDPSNQAAVAANRLLKKVITPKQTDETNREVGCAWKQPSEPTETASSAT